MKKKGKPGGKRGKAGGKQKGKKTITPREKYKKSISKEFEVSHALYPGKPGWVDLDI